MGRCRSRRRDRHICLLEMVLARCEGVTWGCSFRKSYGHAVTWLSFRTEFPIWELVPWQHFRWNPFEEVSRRSEGCRVVCWYKHVFTKWLFTVSLLCLVHHVLRLWCSFFPCCSPRRWPRRAADWSSPDSLKLCMHSFPCSGEDGLRWWDKTTHSQRTVSIVRNDEHHSLRLHVFCAIHTHGIFWSHVPLATRPCSTERFCGLHCHASWYTMHTCDILLSSSCHWWRTLPPRWYAITSGMCCTGRCGGFSSSHTSMHTSVWDAPSSNACPSSVCLSTISPCYARRPDWHRQCIQVSRLVDTSTCATWLVLGRNWSSANVLVRRCDNRHAEFSVHLGVGTPSGRLLSRNSAGIAWG